ncbi:hypothetical protein KQI65_00640 [bacterium]|nr:hypothetical protein [bacterium]
MRTHLTALFASTIIPPKSLRTTASCIILLAAFLMAPADVLAQRELPTDKSDMFSGSGNCQLCHAAGTKANIDKDGKDVSPPSSWRSAMMANSARDPFWQAQVMNEAGDLPAIAGVVQDKCTNCHTPMGHEEAQVGGDTEFTLAEAELDPLSMDGVSCTLCHQVTDEDFGEEESFSGGYDISETRVAFGPYSNPLINPMRNLTGFEPQHAPHMEQSEHCATCHTLYTPYVDASGNIVGEFPEQTPFLEWKASVYPSQNRSCQSCHMPALQEAIPISSMPGTSPARTPYFQHHFVGGNASMLTLIKAHGDDLGVTAYDADFDRSIARTRTQLQSGTVRLTGSATVQGSQLSVDVQVENLAGHKVPSGFPSRRAWLHVVVRDAQQRTVFESGAWDADGRITGVDEAGFEAHHDVISDAGDVQIWEAVLGNTDGEVTARLLRASQYLKDNRLPPAGFTNEGMLDPDFGAVGVPLSDASFNDFDGSGNSGGDALRYALSVGDGGPFTVDVEMCYQSVKPLFIDNLTRQNTAEANSFLAYHQQLENKVEVIATLALSTDVNAVSVLPDPGIALQLYPQPLSLSATGSAQLVLTLTRPSSAVDVRLLNVLGQEVRSWQLGGLTAGHHQLQLPLHRLTAGNYFIAVAAGSSTRMLPVTVLP